MQWNPDGTQMVESAVSLDILQESSSYFFRVLPASFSINVSIGNFLFQKLFGES